MASSENLRLIHAEATPSTRPAEPAYSITMIDCTITFDGINGETLRTPGPGTVPGPQPTGRYRPFRRSL